MQERFFVLWFALAVVVAACTSSQEISDATASTTVEPSATAATAAPVPATTVAPAPTTLTPPPLTTSAAITTSPPTTLALPQPHWITVEGSGWVDRRTGVQFVPRGVNLLRKRQLSGDFLFANYDPAWVDQQLDEITGLGFNTVRFFLDLCRRCTTSDVGIHDAYLDDLTDLLWRMAERGLVALPTSNDVPDDGYSNRMACCEPFGGYRNSLYLSAEGHAIAVEYWTDLITGLQEREAPLHAVLGWQLVNEQFFQRNVAPISVRSGAVTTADGETYDLADDAAVRAMLESNLLRYISEVGKAIRELDQGSLVTIGFFPADEPDAGRDATDDRWVLPAAVVHRSDVDFVDLHAYPGFGGTWDVLAPAFGLDEPAAIPLLLGEFGAFTGAYSTSDDAAAAMAQWQVASCDEGFGGWLVWFWGAELDDEVITANVNGADIGNALSPNTRPDACDVGTFAGANLALGRPATASAEESAEYAARWVTDGSVGTWWSAADGPPQWVEIDLGTPQPVGRVEILVGSVSPIGPQSYRVYIRSDGEQDPGRLAGKLTTIAAEGDVLVLPLDSPADAVRHVRVEVIAMRDWVILHEVQVYAP